MLRRRPSTLDHETALRLVAGAVQPDDAPPGYSRVALLLSEAASTPPPVPAPRAAATVAAMVEAVRTSSPGKVPRFSRRGASGRSISTKVAVVAGTLVLTAGGAAAATGSLPPSLQDATARVASYVGLNLPFPGGTDAGDGDDNSSTDPANPFAPAGAGSAGAGHSQRQDPAFDTVPASTDNGPDAGSSSGPGQAVVSDGGQPDRPQSDKTGTRNRGTDPDNADTKAEQPRDPGEPKDPREAEPAAPVEPKDPVEVEPPNPTEPRDPSEPHDPAEPVEGGGARGAFSPTTEDS
jgi:hypothetical protein